MKLDPDKMAVDESISNPSACAVRNSQCPMPEPGICFWTVMGLLGRFCDFVKAEKGSEMADCTYGEDVPKMDGA